MVGVGGKVDPASKRWYFDVDEESVAQKASYLTPNIGDVGLATRARLLKNLIITTYMTVAQTASPRLLARPWRFKF